MKDGKLKKCKHLVRLKRGMAICRVYTNPSRVGMKIGDGVVCLARKDSKHDYSGCPFNTYKPIFRGKP